MVLENKVIVKWKIIDLKADTICVHGDGKHALEFVTQIRNELMKEALIFNPYRGQKMGKIQNKISIKKDKILNSQNIDDYYMVQFLMATSAIGPAFLTQTAVFTAQFYASFAFAILISIIIMI